MILTHIVDNNTMLKLTQDQGHKVKGQGKKSNFVEKECFGDILYKTMIYYL